LGIGFLINEKTFDLTESSIRISLYPSSGQISTIRQI